MITKIPAALSWKYPNVEGIQTKGDQVTKWPSTLPPLTQALVDQAELEYSKIQKIQNIKAKANNDIVAMMPTWKQRNMTVEGILDLVGLLISKGIITQAELDSRPKASQLLLAWSKVVAIRSKSDKDELSA